MKRRKYYDITSASKLLKHDFAHSAQCAMYFPHCVIIALNTDNFDKGQASHQIPGAFIKVSYTRGKCSVTDQITFH